uniref:Uncharacterized protein n=1 Tax=Anguilla anguilla TaxID=7936 RepID=A0A0E9Q2B0_ANGAN
MAKLSGLVAFFSDFTQTFLIPDT